MTNPKQLSKSENHNHFWIEDHCVYESYDTNRGLRFRGVASVIMEDIDVLSDEDINRVNDILEANYEPELQ